MQTLTKYLRIQNEIKISIDNGLNRTIKYYKNIFVIPKVSIIMNCYNGEAFISDAIKVQLIKNITIGVDNLG